MKHEYERHNVLYVDRVTNYEQRHIQQVANSFKFVNDKKIYINSQILNKNTKELSKANDLSGVFDNYLQNYGDKNKFFCENCSIDERVIVDGRVDDRKWEYVRVGVIADDKSIYTLSKPILRKGEMERLFKEFDLIYRIASKPCHAFTDKMAENMLIYFEPSAAAYIAHEVMGHCFEKDYYEMFTRKIWGKKEEIACNCKYSFYEVNKIGDYILKSMDDRGESQEEYRFILDNGIAQNLISAQRRRDKDGIFQDRMSGTILKSKDENYCFDPREEYIHVYSISSGFVDFMNSKMVVVADLVEEVSGDKHNRIRPLVLEMPLRKMFENIVGMGDKVEVYQNYCIKDGQIIDVYSGAPYLVMKGFSLMQL